MSNCLSECLLAGYSALLPAASEPCAPPRFGTATVCVGVIGGLTVLLATSRIKPAESRSPACARDYRIRRPRWSHDSVSDRRNRDSLERHIATHSVRAMPLYHP